MTDLMRKSPSAGARVPQECLRLMAAFLRVCPEWAPAKGQLRFLVTWAFTDIEAAAAAVGGFTLLRSIIKRRLLLPEVYDVMSRVQDLMIKSQASCPVACLIGIVSLYGKICPDFSHHHPKIVSPWHLPVLF